MAAKDHVTESDDAALRATRITLRPVANPLPLGFLALAAATLMLASLQLGWLGPGESRDVGLALLAFAFPLQLLACIFGFLARDVVIAVDMGVLAGTWLATALVLLASPDAGTSPALGLILLAAAVGLLAPVAASTMSKLAASAVIAATALRFTAAGLYELTANEALGTLAGSIGIVLFVLSSYTATAMVLEDAKARTVLPLGRRGAGERALERGLEPQVREVDQEAGVRTQL